MLSAASVC